MKKLIFAVALLTFSFVAFNYVEKSDGVKYRAEIETLTNKVERLTTDRDAWKAEVVELESELHQAPETKDQSTEED